MVNLSSLLTKRQDKNMNEELKKQEDTEKHLLDKLPIGDVIESVCPECGEPLIEKWSGVKCSKCEYWECY